MLYTIKRINRTVELNDDLVKKYLEYDELRDQPFSIIIRTQFGHAPTEAEISDKDLSILCNDILLSELKALALLPKAVSVVENNYKELKDSTELGEMKEYPL